MALALIGPIVILFKLDGTEPTHVAKYYDKAVGDIVEFKFHTMIDEGRTRVDRRQAISITIPLQNWHGSKPL